MYLRLSTGNNKALGYIFKAIVRAGRAFSIANPLSLLLLKSIMAPS